MVVIGFDLGSREAGCVVMENDALVAAQRFRARSCGGTGRMQFWAWADNLVEVYCAGKNDCTGMIAAESVFYGKYASAVISIARLLGIVEAVAHRHGVRFMEIRASEAKVALTSVGNADKRAMQAEAESQFPFPGHAWNEHTADALGVALCAAGKLRLEAMVKEESYG